MPSPRYWHRLPLLIWVLQVFLPLCFGTKGPRLNFPSTAFVAITGEDLNVHYELAVPANQSKDVLTCFDPRRRPISTQEVAATQEIPVLHRAVLQLKTLVLSGEYHCQYKAAKAYLFLRLRDEGYTDVAMRDYVDLIAVGFCNCVLLLFSVVSSVYVFRGTWKKKIPKCGNPSNDRKQNKERGRAEKPEDDAAGVITASSTSLYASLEPRPRSIYDVLDRSAVDGESQQRNPAPKPKTGQKPVERGTRAQDESVFESVYENF